MPRVTTFMDLLKAPPLGLTMSLPRSQGDSERCLVLAYVAQLRRRQAVMAACMGRISNGQHGHLTAAKLPPIVWRI